MSTGYSTFPKKIRPEAVPGLLVSRSPLFSSAGGSSAIPGAARFASFRVFLLSLCLFCSWSTALADTLRIEIQPSLTVQENTLEGTITVLNRGDEPSRKVRAEMALPGETVVKEVIDLLEVRQAASFSFKKHLGEIKPGTYAVPITILFHDAKLYPFSALACPTFTLGESFSSGLSCSTAPVEKGGEIGFEVKNLDPFPKQIKCTFLFPREFHCPRPERLFTLQPLERKTLSFHLLHATAIPGAHYPVFSMIEMESEKAHYCSVCPGEIRFLEQGNWFKRTRWHWLAGWILLTLLVILLRKKCNYSFYCRKRLTLFKRYCMF